jgi:hypothetical protein
VATRVGNHDHTEAPSRSASALGRTQLVAAIVAWLMILGTVVAVLAPTLAIPMGLGSHDWDQMEAHRYLVVKTIRRFHQFPFWNPYACGGHPNWGGFESGSTVVSPWLPFYLTMTLPHAMRVEIWGSALLSALGAWLLAGRFTSSPAARALVVVVFAVNTRWGLQVATGHTWHLAYAWTPWTLYFYDRAVGADPLRGRPRPSDFVLCAGCIATMAYTGGIYPLPQTAVAICLYAAFLSAITRSFRPALVAGIVGGLGFGLSAPKLLPVMDVIARYPRIAESPESIDLTAFVQILTSQDQGVGSHPARVNASWGWHEFGMYVGWPVVCAVTLGTLLARGTRESPLKWVGLVFLVLGFGSFDPHAPWPLIHHLPIFRSQHVPSRWQYPALVILLTITAAALERWLGRAGKARAWLEVALLACVGWVAYDIGRVARQPLGSLVVPVPSVQESTGPFHTEIHLPPELAYTVEYVPLSLSAEMANVGTIDCGTFPGLNNYIRGDRPRSPGLGARGRGDPEYKGEAYVDEGVGDATIDKWTPNEVIVSVHGARAGEHIVLNQNWDAGWSVGGRRALNLRDQVAGQLPEGSTTVVFRYRPRLWWAGVLVFAATVLGLLWARRVLTRKGSATRDLLVGGW